MAVRLAQQVEWRNRATKVKPTGIATLTPKGGVPIEVTRPPLIARRRRHATTRPVHVRDRGIGGGWITRRGGRPGGG